ncbi:MAG TPA: hypothetical protein VGA69_00130 [Nitriliruptorales bacterium]
MPVAGTGLRAQDAYKADAGNQLAAAMGFLPLLLLALSMAGCVLIDEQRGARPRSSRRSSRRSPGSARPRVARRATVVGLAMASITENAGVRTL